METVFDFTGFLQGISAVSPENKAPRTSFEMRGDFILATSYFRRAYRPTIIGATVFHFRVRKGNGWGHCAMVTRLPTTRVRHDWVSGDKIGILFLENCIQVKTELIELLQMLRVKMEQCKTNG